MKHLSLIAFMLSILAFTKADACTGIKLVAKDGSQVQGRTLEFGTTIDTSIAVIPRGYSFAGTTPEGKGLIYKAKYAAVGAVLFDDLDIADGINEKGLSIGTFYFPGYAGYTDITAKNQFQALSPLEFPNWILTQFASVDEVKIALRGIVIAPTISPNWGIEPPPFHYIIYDKEGNCLVVEPLSGKLITYENKIGMFTNSPAFDWQMTYLRNFINLKAVNSEPTNIDGLLLKPFGQGSGMVGLPGDFTPPSRFVRAAIFSYTAIPSDNASQSVMQVFHILNQFDIPIGIAREISNGIVHTDYTMLTCARDPQALKYYFKTYEDQTIKVIDLNKFDWDATTIKKLKISGEQTFVDISAKLR